MPSDWYCFGQRGRSLSDPEVEEGSFEIEGGEAENAYQDILHLLLLMCKGNVYTVLRVFVHHCPVYHFGFFFEPFSLLISVDSMICY